MKFKVLFMTVSAVLLSGCLSSYTIPQDEHIATLEIPKPYSDTGFGYASAQDFLISELDEDGCSDKSQLITEDTFIEDGMLVPAEREIVIASRWRRFGGSTHTMCNAYIAVLFEADSHYELDAKRGFNSCGIRIKNSETGDILASTRLRDNGFSICKVK